MRDPTVADLLLLARVLSRIDAARQGSFAATVLVETDIAQQHLAATGACHPRFGDGSLMSRCQRLSPPPEPMANDPDFLTAIIAACRAILQC
jgi:hypothetical protein